MKVKRDKRGKLTTILVAACIVLAIVGVFVATTKAQNAIFSERAVRRTCEFLTVEGTTYAECEDGSQFRVVDAVTPTPTSE